ncbi:MAG: MBL fold metallo-hydrolase, partial [Chloroflexi bacterium]|nr:MBL fold metallo-hydrolase [Chloroflexota bacterium]
MRVTLLGTGSPRPDPERASSSLLVAGGDRTFLVDCGRNVAVQMARAGVDPGMVKELLITHHHFDHICGLDDFALTSWISRSEPALRFYGPPGTREITEALFERVYRTDLASRHGINPRRRAFEYEV